MDGKNSRSRTLFTHGLCRSPWKTSSQRRTPAQERRSIAYGAGSKRHRIFSGELRAANVFNVDHYAPVAASGQHMDRTIEAAITVRTTAAEATLIDDDYFAPGLGEIVNGGRADYSAADDDDVAFSLRRKHRLRCGYDRPHMNGSRLSSRSIASAVTNASPRMVGINNSPSRR